MGKFNTRIEAEKLGIKPYCEKCNKTFSFMYDYFSHMSTHHNVIYEEDLLKRLRLKFCEHDGCKNIVNIKNSLCRSCRQLGENNPIHKVDKEKFRENISKSLKKTWLNEEYRNKVIKGISKPRPEHFKKEQSIRIKKWFDENPEQKEIRSQYMRDGWKNGTYYNHENPSCNRSKAENEIYNYLKNIYGELLNRKTIKWDDKRYFPDMRIRNVVIEYFGDYWHANPNKYNANEIVHHNLTAKEIWKHNEIRIKELEGIIAKVIIIWENDYKNRNSDEEFFNKLIKEIDSYDEYQSI